MSNNKKTSYREPVVGSKWTGKHDEDVEVLSVDSKTGDQQFCWVKFSSSKSDKPKTYGLSAFCQTFTELKE